MLWRGQKLAQFKITRDSDTIPRGSAGEYVIIRGDINEIDMLVAIEGLKKIKLLGVLSRVPGTPTVYFLMREHVGRNEPQRNDEYRKGLIEQIEAI